MQSIAAFLNYRSPNLAKMMVEQLGFDVCLVNNGGDVSLPNTSLRITVPENRYFSGGWNYAMSILADRYDYVWMLNDDVTGVTIEMLDRIILTFPYNAAVVTPAFNSPHREFHHRPGSLEKTSWIDWTCPVVKTAAWRITGDFDDAFIGYGADLDWCKRARLFGWEFYVDQRHVVHHIGSVTAIDQGLQGIQGNVSEMNRVLKEKWGVEDWTAMR